MMALKSPVDTVHPFAKLAMDAIYWADRVSPRSVQQDLGPSEIGSPCPRQIAYKLAGAAEVNRSADYWFAILGTAAHAWLADALNRYQQQVLGRGVDNPRFLIEQRVLAVGANYATPGHTDVYDIDQQRVVDWKLVGSTSLKKVKLGEIRQQYRVQAHTYGLGWIQRGYPVREVMNVYLPRSTFLKNLHVWVEPYNEQIALDALERVARIDQLRRVVPIGAVPPGECSIWCPFLRPGTLDDRGCPGHQPNSEED